MRRIWRRAFRRLLVRLLTLMAVIGSGTGAVLAGAALYRWMMTSDEFAVADVVTVGNRYIDRDELVALADIKKGINIFHTDLADAAFRLRRDPRLQDVFIRRQYPNRIVIHLKEREPVAYINTDRLYGIDRHGVAVPLPVAESLPNLPIITGLVPARTVPAFQNEASENPAIPDSSSVNRALLILQALRLYAPELLDTISEVHVANAYDPILYTMEEGIAIRLGVGRYKDKLQRLYFIQQRLKQDGIGTTSIDLRFDNQVIIRPIVAALPFDHDRRAQPE